MSDILPQPLSDDESEQETDTELDTLIQRFENERRSAARLNTLKTLLKKRRERENTMMQTETNELSSEGSGRGSIVSGSERPDESGIKPESQDFHQPIEESLTAQKSSEEITPSTSAQPSELQEPSSGSTLPTSEIIASPSMSLLDEAATHIFGLMKGLHANVPPSSIKAYDPERVNAAVGCANTLQKIMRLKLDAIKVQAGLKKVDRDNEAQARRDQSASGAEEGGP